MLLHSTLHNTCTYTHFLEQQNIMQATSTTNSNSTTPPAAALAMIIVELGVESALGVVFTLLLTEVV